MRPTIKRSLTALLVAGAAAFGFAGSAAALNSGSNSRDACIGIVGGCAPNGTGYLVGGDAQVYSDPTYANGYQHAYTARHTNEGVYHNGY